MNFLSKGILTSGGHVVAATLSMLAGILFARTLGPVGMGQYSLFLSTVTMAAGIFGLGLGSANVFSLNNRKTPTEDIVSNAIKTAMVLGLVLTCGLTWAFTTYQDYFGRLPLVIAAAVAM
jgi:O-antigen/teichoic acid export membrane protein